MFQFKDLNLGSELQSLVLRLDSVQFKVLNRGSEPLPKSLCSSLVGWFSGSKGRFSSSSRDLRLGATKTATLLDANSDAAGARSQREHRRHRNS